MVDRLADRLCNVTEINNNEMIQLLLLERSWNQWFLSKKSFCTRRSRKKKYFRRFDHKTHKRKVVGISMDVEACEGYKMIEKFEVYS